MVDVWDPNIIIVSYVDPRQAPERGKVICPMRTFVWNKFGGRFATRAYQQDETTSTVVQSLDFVDEKVVIADAAYLLTGAMAADDVPGSSISDEVPPTDVKPAVKGRKTPKVTPPDADVDAAIAAEEAAQEAAAE